MDVLIIWTEEYLSSLLHLGPNITMASRLRELLNLQDKEAAEAWMVGFEAKARIRKYKDTVATPTDASKMDLTDSFLESAGTEALTMLKVLVAPLSLNECTYKTFKEAIMRHLEPKRRLLISERTKFWQMRLQSDEDPENYLQRIRLAAKQCQFEELKTKEPAEELTKVQLIAGLSDKSMINRVLNFLETKEDSTADEVVDYVRRQIDVGKFTYGQEKAQGQILAANKTNKFQRRNANYSGMKYRKYVPNYNKERRNINGKPNDYSTGNMFDCTRCGRKHGYRQCPAFGKTCTKCNGKNHFHQVCRKVISVVEESESDAQLLITSSTAKTSSLNNYRKVLKIAGTDINFQVDTGSPISTINEYHLNRIPGANEKIYKDTPKPMLEDFGGASVFLTGCIRLKLRCTDTPLTMWVSPSGPAVLGRDAISALNLLPHLNVLTDIKLPDIHLKLKPGAQPIRLPSRRIAYALEDPTKQEIESMEATGVITKIEDSDWAFPIVPVVKNRSDNGKIEIRITGDFKKLNSQLQLPVIRMPTRDKLLQITKGAKFFTKIDLKKAYHQLKLSNASKKYATISTPWGLYRYNFLPQGISSAPGEFQTIIEDLIKDLPGTAAYYDDLLVVGTTESELKGRTENLLRKLQSAGLEINITKCQFDKKSVIFLGHHLSEQGIQIDPERTEALTKCDIPRSKDELCSFLGMINFYNSFVKNFSSLTAPLYDMTKTDNTHFKWSKEANKSWQGIINALRNAPILVPYDPKKEVVLTTDASQRGLGAVLSQNGRPVAFASKKLSPTQEKYSVLEKESMAFFWAVTEKFSLYLKGRDFIWQTDHQPLEKLFHPDTPLSKIASARVHRWARALMPFSYRIIGKRSSEIPVADGLSRLPFEPSDRCEPDLEYVAILDCNPLSHDEIRLHSVESESIKEIVDCLVEGKRIRNGPYAAIKNELSVHDNILFYGDRPVIPESLRDKVLQSLHMGHPGIVQMKGLARSSVFWPGITKDCERTTTKCEICQTKKTTAVKNVYTSWPSTKNYGDRIHIDFLGPIQGKMILILVDAYTGWIDAYHTINTTASDTIRLVRKSFSRFGVPKQVISDSGPQFISKDFHNWLRSIGVQHIYSPPYHPASNGAAERAVRSFKEKERTLRNIGDFHKRMDNILVALNSGSGADLKMLGRKLWSPVITETPKPIPSQPVKNPVWFRLFHDSDKFWEKGLAKDITSSCIEGEDLNGNEWRRSRNHIKIRELPEEESESTKCIPESQAEECKSKEPELRRSTRIRKPIDRFVPS